VIKYFHAKNSFKTHENPHRRETSALTVHQIKTPISSLVEQMKTETDEEDSEGPEPARNPDPHGHLQSNIDDKMSLASLTVC